MTPDQIKQRRSPVRVAGPLLSTALRSIGCAGIALPWGAYIIPEWHDDEEMHLHEIEHLAQIKRDGIVWFLVKYFYWLARYGYADNPYEIEARQRAMYGVTTAEVVSKGLKRPEWMASPPHHIG